MFPITVWRALGVAALLSISAAPALAETTTPTPSPAPEIAHVVTSDRSETTLKNTARTTYVVTSAEIARHGDRTIGDAIARVPGVEIAHYGAIGSAVQYGIRGSGSAQVLVLIDGVPAPGSFANSVDLGSLTTAGVARVEIVEGGGSTLYGAGALGGIINVITDSQSATPSAQARYGSFGDRELQVSGKGFAFERIAAENTARSNSDYEATSVHAGYDRRLGAISAAFRAGISGTHLGAPGYDMFPSPTGRENDTNANVNAAFALRRSQSLATLQLSGTHQQLAYECLASDANCFTPGVSVSTEARTEATFRNVVTGAAERLIYGFDLGRGVVRSDSGGFATPPVSIDALAQSAAYVQENIQFGGASRAYAGLRAERDGALGGEFSPSAGLVFALAHDRSIKVNYASAFRAPDASELYFPGYGNPHLSAERAHVGDVTYVDPRLLGGVSFGWFTNRTRNLIVPVLIDPVNFIYEPENVDNALMQGFVLDMHTRPYHHVSTGLSITDLYRAQDVTTQARLPHDPVLSVNMELAFSGEPDGRFESGGINVRAVGQNGPVTHTLPLFDQPAAYTTLDAFVRLRVRSDLLLTMRGYNLGNERYAEVAGYPMQGRSFAIELGTK